MANRRVRVVRSLKIDGKAVFCAPDTTPKGAISSEIVLYKGRKLKFPPDEGRWYLRWEEGSKPKWQRCESFSDALHQQVRKQIELQAVSAGIEVKPDDPSRLRLLEALQQYIDDQKLLKRSKKTLAAHRITKESFLRSCHKTFLDQVERRDLLNYAESLRKEGLSERTVFTRWIAVMSILKFHGIRGLAKRGDTPRYVENEPEAYTQEELDALFAACKPEYHVLYTFYLRTGFRKQEVMYLEYHDLDFRQRTVSVTSKAKYGFRPKSWDERTIPLEEGLALALEARCSADKRKGLVFPTRNGKPNGKHRLALTRIAKRAGLDDSRFWLHKFRATAATTWLRGTIDIRTVQSLLGHKDLASTMRYLKPMAGSDLHKKMNGLYAATSAGV
jgi:integrase/recombinase XerD